jgi:hypothetical protein
MNFTAAITVGVSDALCGRICVGFNWTVVEALFPNGPVLGLAATPSKSDDAHTTPQTGSFGGRPLSELAPFALSANPYERVIGIAACNAHWAASVSDSLIKDTDGLAAEPGERVVVIGRFPGLDQKLPNAIVLEKRPGPNDIPAERAPEIIPDADRLIITASTLVNGSIDHLVALARPNCAITMVGPGTPLCPALFDHGVDRLAGFLVTDTELCFKAIMEGAGARAFRRHGQPVLLNSK